jgi:hypothetical protein
MPYKMVLVGMYYEGEEPKVYPDCLHDEDDWYCQCEQSVAKAIDTSIKENQKNVKFVDTAFLQYQDNQEDLFKSWKTVYKRNLWKMFVFLYKR